MPVLTALQRLRLSEVERKQYGEFVAKIIRSEELSKTEIETLRFLQDKAKVFYSPRVISTPTDGAFMVRKLEWDELITEGAYLLTEFGASFLMTKEKHPDMVGHKVMECSEAFTYWVKV